VFVLVQPLKKGKRGVSLVDEAKKICNYERGLQGLLLSRLQLADLVSKWAKTSLQLTGIVCEYVGSLSVGDLCARIFHSSTPDVEVQLTNYCGSAFAFACCWMFAYKQFGMI
jgi:hypothetical protein